MLAEPDSETLRKDRRALEPQGLWGGAVAHTSSALLQILGDLAATSESTCSKPEQWGGQGALGQSLGYLPRGHVVTSKWSPVHISHLRAAWAAFRADTLECEGAPLVPSGPTRLSSAHP